LKYIEKTYNQAKVTGQVVKSSRLPKKGFEINTDDNGQVSYSWRIKQTAGTTGTYRVGVTVLAPGYQEKTATTSFKVKPSALGTLIKYWMMSIKG
jgi:uncharacterized GH25 family protein